MADIADVMRAVLRLAQELKQLSPVRARHLPEAWTKTERCFENVMMKVDRDGGVPIPGWMFHLREVASRRGHEYLVASHHAIWGSPDGKFVDVTPFHDDPKHHPITDHGHVIVLIDDTSPPKTIKGRMTALPMKYLPLSDDTQLIAYLEELTREERERAEALYAHMETLAPVN